MKVKIAQYVGVVEKSPQVEVEFCRLGLLLLQVRYMFVRLQWIYFQNLPRRRHSDRVNLCTKRIRLVPV